MIVKFVAGEEQMHFIDNAMSVLANHGFLRCQGILTLEAIQIFYDLVEENMAECRSFEVDLRAWSTKK